MYELDPRAFGLTDDQANFAGNNAAMNACMQEAKSTGMAIGFPPTKGYYRFTDPIVINKKVTLKSDSPWGVALYGDFDGPIIHFTSSAGKTRFDNFWIHNLSDLGIGVLWDGCHRSLASNIHVGLGHLGVAFENRGSMHLNLDHLFASSNGSQRFYGSPPKVGFKFIVGIGSRTVNLSMLSNSSADGCGTGLLMDGGLHNDSLRAYMTVLNSTFQGCNVNISVNNCQGFNFTKVHSEGLNPTSTKLSNVHHAFFNTCDLGNMEMDNCVGNSFAGGTIHGLKRNKTNFNRFNMVALGVGKKYVQFQSSSNSDRFIQCYKDNYDANSLNSLHYPDIGNSSFVVSDNGLFDDWSGNYPEGYEAYNGASVYKDTIIKMCSKQSCKIVSNGENTYEGLSFDLSKYHRNIIPRGKDAIPAVDGQLITVTAHIRRPGGQETLPRIAVWYGYYNWFIPHPDEIINDEFVRLTASFMSGSNAAKVVICVGENAADGEYIHVDLVTITVGPHAPAVYSPRGF